MPPLFPVAPALERRILREVERAGAEIAAFTGELIRIPTVNPPGEHYRECAEFLGERLGAAGFAVEYDDPPRSACPPNSARWPRRNVIGRRGSGGRRLHLNGHLDVVPAGAGWTGDPFSGEIRDGSVWGRGASDMKGGVAAAVFAAEALRRAGVRLGGVLEISGSVDEESGGRAGVAWLAESGRIAPGTDAVIIPEPFGSHRVCVGHRGVYWFRVVSEGETAHGAMPFLGRNAISQLAPLLEEIRADWAPELAGRRTALPVVPEGARAATVNVNSIVGGQAGAGIESPQVPDRAEIVVDRRFLPEEGLERVRSEVARRVAACAARDPARRYRIEELLTVEPVRTPPGSLATEAVRYGVRGALGREVEEVASPGTYDHKHVTRIAGIADCVAYGPGILEQAHRPDEHCPIEELTRATGALALAAAAVLGACQQSVDRAGRAPRPARRPADKARIGRHTRRIPTDSQRRAERSDGMSSPVECRPALSTGC